METPYLPVVIINGRFLSQPVTGVQRFAYEMTCALVRKGLTVRVVAPRVILPIYQDVPFSVEKTHQKDSHIWEQCSLPRYVNKHYPKALLLNFTGLSPLCYANSILTIHDVSYLVNPQWFSKCYYYFYKVLTPLAAKRAKHIVTVSEFSRSEIMAYLHIASKRISVVYNAPVPLENRSTELIDTKPYILAVSSLDPRKNLNRLIEAYKTLVNPSFDLYIVGAKNRVFSVDKFESCTGIRFFQHVEWEQLAILYQQARGFISPSLYEGFGLPNLEAMEAGCPVAAADIPVYHEICGDSVLFFDPYSVSSIAQAMVQIMTNDLLREQLRGRTQGVLNRFKWEQSANSLIQCLQQQNLL